MRKLLLILALMPLPAWASCTGIGTTWSCTAGSTSSQIQTAINSATDGFTMTFAAGSYTISVAVNFSNTIGGTLICASAGACTINYSSSYTFGGDSFSGTNTHFYRISGFVFDGGGGTPGPGAIWFDNAAGCGGSGSCPVTMIGAGFGGIRIDHNTFQNQATGSSVIFFGHNNPSGATIPVGHYYGVIDHNAFNFADVVVDVQYIGYPDPTPPSNQLGTVNNMFLEDNTFTNTAMTSASNGACTDGWGGAAYVVRHNTSTNCLWAAHGATHAGGPANYEFYSNSVALNSSATGESPIDCYRCWHMQGSGTAVAFNNTFTTPAGQGYDSEIISVANYRGYANGPSIDAGIAACDGTVSGLSYDGVTVTDGNRTPSASNYGYPCWHQPGRDFAANYAPMYYWNNQTGAGALISMVNPDFGGTVPTGFPPSNCTTTPSGNCDYNSFQMKANREWYNAVSVNAQSSPSSPFSGTTGMGFGTLANRPTTCTTNSTESGAGVGYFATDVGSQGTLYTCSATNTWNTYYTPYTYPHPLIGGSVATPTFSPTPGNYGSAQTVTLATSTTGATICYTTNGSTPTTNGGGTCLAGSSIYSAPFLISSTSTVKAVGTLSGSSDSSIATGVYTINGSASAPTFSPVAGSYGPTQSVVISSSTSGATICYTTDGSTPTADGNGTCTHGTTYTVAVSVASSLTLKAVASKSGWNDSTVSSAAYIINGAASTPTFSPAAGSYGPAQSVTISTSTSGATVCYTTSGSAPASSSPGVCAAGSTQYVSPVSVSFSLTLKAIATKAGFSDSSVGSAAYTINGAVNTPTFSPVAGIYTSTQNVTISTSTSGSSCFYTTDGSTPTPSSTPYTTPVVISSTATLKAICTKTGFSDSSVASGAYTIATGCIIGFSPGAGTYTGTQSVTISTSGCTAGTKVFYRTDGLPATNIDTQYSSPVSVSSSQTLTAKAVISPTVRDQPQTITGQKKCNATGSPITFPSGYSCNNGSGGVAGTASNFNFVAGSSNQMFVSTTDSVAFDTSVLLIDTPASTDNNIVDQSFRKVYQDSSNCSQTSPNLYKCIDVSETDAESCCDATTHALWQMSVRCSTNAAGSSGNNGFLEGDASSGNEKWDIPCVIGSSTDLTVNSHWALGDTGCGGSGCMVLDSIYLNGTEYDFPASCDSGDTHCPNYPMTPQPTYGNFVGGSQDQVYARNVGVAGTSPLTTTRSISFSRVGVDEGSETTGSAAFVIGVNDPTFSPAPGTYGPAQSVTLSDATVGATICYTTDGTTPSATSGACTHGTTYSTAIPVSVTTTIKAIASQSGLSDSNVVSGTYTINGPAATPTFSPVAGTYVGAQSVTLSCSTASPTMYYTTDGSTPTTSSTVYTSPISVPVSLTVKAICTAAGFSNSSVGSAAYVITAPEVTVSVSGKIQMSGKIGVQ